MGPEWPKSTTEAYDPQGSGIGGDIDAPGIANSGNLKHKWDVPGDHSNSSEPPSGEKSE